MSKVIIMGMMFDEGDVPDFGSIYRAHEMHDNTHEYGLNAADAAKLSLITNAAPGATALCTDTADIYILTKTGWAKFGEEAETETAGSNSSPKSLNLSPIDIDKAALTSAVSFDEGEGSAFEAHNSAVTSSTADEVSI